ncbi:hypothetical protein [Leisingera sp.]|uniref:WD40 repeat domain-containing protein n=1 Tax=Leisingera sp. TaxID=1879318 RepID=UPI002B27C004|nr:hypothetical protein [Leisingera sp.]
MTQHMPPQAMSLFDLIARTWHLEGQVRQVLFNAGGTSLAVALADGRLAFIRTEDAEHPEKRLRMELDTGRTSIRPREKPLPLPMVSDVPIANVNVAISRLGDQGFAFAPYEGGGLWRATARGQTLKVPGKDDRTVTALAALPNADRILVARGSELSVVAEAGAEEIAHTEMPHEVTHIATSPDGSLLGCWGPGHVSVLATAGLDAIARIACGGEVIALSWSPCNRWLVAGCRDKSVLLVDVPAGSIDRIVDFPEAVRAVDFSGRANAMVTSGAFRVAGWTLPDLPFGDHQGAPIETGRAGLTIVDIVAVHPVRDLCAVSYANGLVTICRIGHPDEMMLREGTGAPVSSLVWSDGGEHLAMGTEDGKVSIATFPKNMFK